MKNKYLVSVVIPCTDRINGLERCLNSALNQQGDFQLEILLIENNSKDRNILKALIDKFNNSIIRHYYLDECKNANVARNFGTSKSKGHFIAYLDSDDYWGNIHIRSRLDFTTNNPDIHAQYSGHRLHNGLKFENIQSRDINSENAYSFLFGKNSSVAQTSSYFLKKSVFDTVSWDESLKRNQDYDFFITVQNAYGWTHNPIISTTVVWEVGEKRLYSVDSFKQFYSKHGPHMNELVRANYLAGVLRALCLNSKKEYMEFLMEGRLHRRHMAMPGRLYSYGYNFARIVINIRTLLNRLA